MDKHPFYRNPKQFHIVTTTHKDMTERLPALNASLAEQVREILDVNKAERHIRGGLATKAKYELLEETP